MFKTTRLLLLGGAVALAALFVMPQTSDAGLFFRDCGGGGYAVGCGGGSYYGGPGYDRPYRAHGDCGGYGQHQVGCYGGGGWDNCCDRGRRRDRCCRRGWGGRRGGRRCCR